MSALLDRLCDDLGASESQKKTMQGIAARGDGDTIAVRLLALGSAKELLLLGGALLSREWCQRDERGVCLLLQAFAALMPPLVSSRGVVGTRCSHAVALFDTVGKQTTSFIGTASNATVHCGGPLASAL